MITNYFLLVETEFKLFLINVIIIIFSDKTYFSVKSLLINAYTVVFYCICNYCIAICNDSPKAVQFAKLLTIIAYLFQNYGTHSFICFTRFL